MATATLLKEINHWVVIEAVVIISLPFALFLYPQINEDAEGSICLLKNIFEHECYGCGITRAFLAAIHLNFEKAFLYNKFIVIIFPVTVFLWWKKVVGLGKGLQQSI